MPTPKFQKGNPGKPKGAKNKLTTTFKQLVIDTVEALQKDPKHNLKAFAEKNPKEFWMIAARLIPTELDTAGAITSITIIRE